MLQAVIFGAGHANYPQQPAYARVVEIFLPAVGFGLIFLAALLAIGVPWLYMGA